MTPATERTARWRRYLADLEAHAAVPHPLVSEGMLVRVTGLVLEAAGVRAPVGSVCEVSAASGAPVNAEVVGFHRDRAYLMPTGDLHGLASGARVVPRPAPQTAPQLGRDNPLWRRSEDRGLHLPWAWACSAAWSTLTASRWTDWGRCNTHARNR